MPEQTLKEFLAQQLSTSPEVKRLVLGFSGGLDSTVLLQALLNVLPSFHLPVLAVHVHHGLSPNADAWAAQVAAFCEKNAVALDIHHVQVARGASVEAAARAARFAAFAKSLQAGDALLLAQHEDDQAETLLFRLLRGAGVTGLGAMHAVSRFSAAGDLAVPCWRPFLGLSRRTLERYASANGLQWIEDESNQDSRYARNFLRREIFPQLKTRWPALTQTLAATATRLQEADVLLDELAAEIARCAVDDRQRLSVAALLALSPARRRLLLRYWLRAQALPLPGAGLLEKISELALARADATPCLAWPGCEIRRYRDHVYAMPPLPPVFPEWQCQWDGKAPLSLPDGRVLLMEIGGDVIAGRDLTVRYRRGGERFRMAGQSRKLKTLMQEVGIPPWERERLPLVFAGDELIVVVGLSDPA